MTQNASRRTRIHSYMPKGLLMNSHHVIHVINSTDKIKHGEILIYDEFQFVDLSYFHKWFIRHFNHISQPFNVTRLCYVQKQPERNDDSGHAENAVKKSKATKQHFSYFSSDILITEVKKNPKTKNPNLSLRKSIVYSAL